MRSILFSGALLVLAAAAIAVESDSNRAPRERSSVIQAPPGEVDVHDPRPVQFFGRNEDRLPERPPRAPRAGRVNDCESAFELPPDGQLALYDLEAGAELWFRYTGEGHGIDLRTCYPQTTIDTDLSIFESCGGSELLVFDGGECYVGGGSLTYHSVSLEEEHFYFLDGVEYFIRIDGYFTDLAGQVALSVDRRPPCVGTADCPLSADCDTLALDVRTAGADVILDWAPLPNAYDYRVLHAAEAFGEAYVEIQASTLGQTSWTHSHALAQPRGFYRVEALCAGGEVGYYEQEEECGDTNGGCIDGVSQTEEIPLGVNVCATMWSYPQAETGLDYFHFVLTEPSVVTISLTSYCLPMKLWFQTESCQNDGFSLGRFLQAHESTDRMTTQCLPSGEYWLICNSINNLQYSCNEPDSWHYGLRVDAVPCQWVDPCQDLEPLYCNEAPLAGDNTGRIDYNFDGTGEAWFSLEIEELSRVDVDLCSPLTEEWLRLRLFDECEAGPWNQPMHQTANGPDCPESPATEIPLLKEMYLRPGSYPVTVDGTAGWREGAFGLRAICEPYDCTELLCNGEPEVEPNNGPAPLWQGDGMAMPMALGTTICGSVSAHDGVVDYDVFELSLEEAASLTIFLEAEYFNPVLEVIDQAYSLMHEIDSTSYCRTEQLVTDCLLPGTYYIRVRPTLYTGLEEGRYSLGVIEDLCTPCPPPDCAGAIPEGEGYYPGFDPPQYEDTVNGGCNTNPPGFDLLECGMSRCGSYFTYYHPGEQTWYRDMDWFHLPLETDAVLSFDTQACGDFYTVWVMSSCGGEVLYLGYGIGDQFMTTPCIPAGDYVAFIAPADWEGYAYETEWSLTMTCLPCN